MVIVDTVDIYLPGRVWTFLDSAMATFFQHAFCYLPRLDCKR